MRLDGQTLAATHEAIGLSVPTIIAAVKAYHAGGWDSVDVAARGRPKRTAEQNDANLEHLFKQLVVSSSLPRTAHIGHPLELMNVERFDAWLKKQGHPLSRSAQRSLLNSWSLQPENRYRRLRDNAATQPDGNSSQWLAQHNKFASRARRDSAALLWVGSRALQGSTTQLYAQDLRGRSHWCLVHGSVQAHHIAAFLQALAQLLKQPLALVFTNTQLPRIQALSDWLAASHTRFLCIDESANAPSSKLTSGPDMTETAKAEEPTRPDKSPGSPSENTLTHLQRLEAESIHIMREVVAEAENPVMLYSIGKDSAVMLHLARKAFYPAVPPFPLLHVDTTWKFKAMYEFRENIVEEYGLELLKHTNPDGLAQNVNPFTHGSALHTDIMKTQGLKQALDEHRFDFAFGGARRDEEKSRAKERVFSFRNAQHRWDAKNQRPELWKLYNARKQRDESIRVFPLSNWTELDIWQYIYKEEIPIVPLYLAAERPVVERDGSLIMVDDERMPLHDGEVPQMRSVRFRTLGCYPLTGAVESTATSLEEIIQEMLLTRTSERQGRMIDHDSSASMEKKKQEGYF